MEGLLVEQGEVHNLTALDLELRDTTGFHTLQILCSWSKVPLIPSSYGLYLSDFHSYNEIPEATYCVNKRDLF